MLKQINEWQILTPDGWSDFDGINVEKSQKIIELVFENNIKFQCTDDHELFLTLKKKIKAINCLNKKILCQNNKKIRVIKINKITKKHPVFDVLNVQKNNRFYAGKNNLLISNCLLIDEAAHIDRYKEEEFVKSVMPVISSSSNTKIFMISCVTDNTYVHTSNGLQQVKEFVQKDKVKGYNITPYNILGKDIVRKGDIMFNNGKTVTNILKTSSSQIECSTEHKFWACQNGIFNWYKSSELKIGDYLSIQYGKELWGNNDDVSTFKPTVSNKFHYTFQPKTITTNLAYLLGLYIAEDNATRCIRNEKFIDGNMDITCGDDINKVFKDLNINYTKADDVHYRISSKEFIEFLEYLGFDLKNHAPQKIIPSRLLQMSRTNIIALLQGIFDGGGSSSSNRGTVSYVSTSYELIEQVRILLMNFGILTSMSSNVSKPTKGIKVFSKHYTIEAAHHCSKIFYDKIGFRLQRKQKNIKQLRLKCNRLYDPIPMTKKMFMEFKKESNINNHDFIKRKINFNQALYLKKETAFSRGLMLKIKHSNIPLSHNFKQFLDVNVSENIKWEKIKEITPSENLVYDFSLPEDFNDVWCHSIVYNGFIGHQTPNGTANHFYKIYSGAERGENGWHNEKIDWQEIPGRDEKWKTRAIADLGSIEAFNQEYGNFFIETGETAIDKDIISEYRREAKVPEILNTNEYKVWTAPNPNSIYVIGGDVSDGVGGAASVLQGLDVTDLTNIKQVFTYRNRFIDTAHFAKETFDIAKQWGKPPILMERNSMGGEVVNILSGKPFNYERMVSYNGSQQIDYNKGGIYSSTNVKYEGVSNMRYWVNSLRALSIYDIATIQELETFVKYPNGTWHKQSGSGLFDDLIMSLVWALFALHTPIAETLFEIIQYDERGKPLKIKRSYYDDDISFGINQYRKDWGDDDFIPAFVGRKSSYDNKDNPEREDLELDGWKVLVNN